MKSMRLAIAAGTLALCWAACARAQSSVDLDDLRQPASVRHSAPDDIRYSYVAQPAPSESPSNLPAPSPPAAKTETPETKTDKAEPKEEKKEEEKKEEEEKPWKLIHGPCLDEHRIDIRGWLDQGFTWNPSYPQDRFNGPVGYNDRANEYELNQLYLITERLTKTDGCGIDVGGRVDLLYGTDRRYVTAYELDSEWNLGERFYGLAMPQAYGDIAVNDLVIRAGHFLAPVGYESVMAPENFFYSHSYSFLYGQPTTVSGGELIYKVNDKISVNTGINTGWNDWLSPNGKINYFGGFNWTSKDGTSTLAFQTFMGNTNPERGVDSDRFHCFLVFTQQLGKKWKYALENNLGYDTNPFGTGVHGDWLGFANYLIYEINDCWSFGMRYEWFMDDDGTVVTRVGPPAAGPYPAHFNEFSWGFDYKPHKSKNLLVRTELRYDWAGDSLPVGQRPFDDGRRNDQVLWGTDVILRF
jgi:hypothetical protein